MNLTDVSTITAAVVATGAAIIAFWQARQSKEQTVIQKSLFYEQASPLIWADILPGPVSGVIRFTVGKSGPNVAHDVEIRTTPPIQELLLEDFLDSPEIDVFRFSAVTPARQMHWLLDPEKVRQACHDSLRIQIASTWEFHIDGKREKQSNTYSIDMGQLGSISTASDGNLTIIADAIDRLRKG